MKRFLNRRELLIRSGAGFGAVGLAATLGEQLQAETTAKITSAGDPRQSGDGLHHPAKAKRVIFLFMNGAPSHVDTFDPKPALEKYAGQPPNEGNGKNREGGFMPSPFQFARHGDSGMEMSELFPNLAKHADDLCVIRSMHTDVPNHEPGLLLMQSGHQQPTRPSIGSWLSYGLGSENKNLPSFIALCPGLPVVGPQLWSNAFLPGIHQGMEVDTNEKTVDRLIANLHHPTMDGELQRKQIALIQQLNQMHKSGLSDHNLLNAHIDAMQTAFRMQTDATDAFDLSKETVATRTMYGESEFARSCLLGRRLLERGVRVVQVFYVRKGQKQPWDTHQKNNEGHRKLCEDADQATAALIGDLKARGMLEDTLIIWGGEFGRTPYAQMNKSDDISKAGRDHHHTGFSMFLAGGGIKQGFTYGQTDELGMHAVHHRVHVHDLHATILHQMGIDHTRLTFRYSGRDYRLTDVHGKVVSDIIC